MLSMGPLSRNLRYGTLSAISRTWSLVSEPCWAAAATTAPTNDPADVPDTRSTS